MLNILHLTLFLLICHPSVEVEGGEVTTLRNNFADEPKSTEIQIGVMDVSPTTHAISSDLPPNHPNRYETSPTMANGTSATNIFVTTEEMPTTTEFSCPEGSIAADNECHPILEANRLCNASVCGPHAFCDKSGLCDCLPGYIFEFIPENKTKHCIPGNITDDDDFWSTSGSMRVQAECRHSACGPNFYCNRTLNKCLCLGNYSRIFWEATKQTHCVPTEVLAKIILNSNPSENVRSENEEPSDDAGGEYNSVRDSLESFANIYFMDESRSESGELETKTSALYFYSIGVLCFLVASLCLVFKVVQYKRNSRKHSFSNA